MQKAASLKAGPKPNKAQNHENHKTSKNVKKPGEKLHKSFFPQKMIYVTFSHVFLHFRWFCDFRGFGPFLQVLGPIWMCHRVYLCEDIQVGIPVGTWLQKAASFREALETHSDWTGPGRAPKFPQTEPRGAPGSPGEPRGAPGSRGEPRGAAGSPGEPSRGALENLF